jgi:dihydrofolate reductase
MRVSIVVAMTPDRLIGAGGKLPWHVPEDLKRFRALTTGHTVVMGRKTFDSIRKPLAKRRNIVITRNDNPPAIEGVEWVTSLGDAISNALHAGDQELFILGGSEIYRQAIERADRMHITYIHLSPPPTGDTYFPPWDESQWTKASEEIVPPIAVTVYYRIRGNYRPSNTL